MREDRVLGLYALSLAVVVVVLVDAAGLVLVWLSVGLVVVEGSVERFLSCLKNAPGRLPKGPERKTIIQIKKILINVRRS